MKIKVCGITRIEQLKALEEMGVDYAGLIFYEGSKRYVGEGELRAVSYELREESRVESRQSTESVVRSEKSDVRGGGVGSQKSGVRSLAISRVGVFVNAEMEMIEQTIKDYGLTAVQLHGDETDEFCLELMDKVEVIKVFRIADQQDIDALVAPFQEVCHYYLFDTSPPAPLSGERGDYGGTGLQFDWRILERAAINKPFFLSGGIGLDDAEKVKAFQHPYFYAVDVNSKFEIAPGVKDLEKIQSFIQQIKP